MAVGPNITDLGGSAAKILIMIVGQARILSSTHDLLQRQVLDPVEHAFGPACATFALCTDWNTYEAVARTSAAFVGRFDVFAQRGYLLGKASRALWTRATEPLTSWSTHLNRCVTRTVNPFMCSPVSHFIVAREASGHHIGLSPRSLGEGLPRCPTPATATA